MRVNCINGHSVQLVKLADYDWQVTLNDFAVARFNDRWEAKEHYERLILALVK